MKCSVCDLDIEPCTHSNLDPCCYWKGSRKTINVAGKKLSVPNVIEKVFCGPNCSLRYHEENRDE